jgi:nucleoid-associated protein YgaU
MEAVRMCGLAVGWYLAVATVLGTCARLLGSVRAVRVADVVALPSLRRLLNATVGASLAVASTAPAAWAEASPPIEEPAPTIRLLPERDRAPVHAAGSADPPAVTTSTSPPTGSPVEEQPTPPPSAPAAVAEPAPPPDSSPPATVPASPGLPAPDEATWTVAGGEHFWSIARQVLARAWQRPPTDREVDPYWRSLVEANRSRLHEPGNADLLFAGQVLTVPRPPPAPP